MAAHMVCQTGSMVVVMVRVRVAWAGGRMRVLDSAEQIQSSVGGRGGHPDGRRDHVATRKVKSRRLKMARRSAAEIPPSWRCGVGGSRPSVRC